MDPRLHDELGRHLDAISSGVAWLVWTVYAICMTAVAAALWS